MSSEKDLLGRPILEHLFRVGYLLTNVGKINCDECITVALLCSNNASVKYIDGLNNIFSDEIVQIVSTIINHRKLSIKHQLDVATNLSYCAKLAQLVMYLDLLSQKHIQGTLTEPFKSEVRAQLYKLKDTNEEIEKEINKLIT